MVPVECSVFELVVLGNLVVLYIMEPNAPPYIGFGTSHDVIDDIMHDIIGIK